LEVEKGTEFVNKYVHAIALVPGQVLSLKSLPSGAEAQVSFRQCIGTTEVVPFQNINCAQGRLLKSCPFKTIVHAAFLFIMQLPS
jgi:hypothetical protein